MRKLDEQLAGLATMSPAQLRAEWQRVHEAPPPPAFSPDMLARDLAYRLQAQAYGGLPASVARELNQLVRAEQSGRACPERIAIRPGSRLARDWRGTTHHVAVLDKGFEYRGQRHSSLSAIAREITGTAWSGPRFFGLLRAPASVGEPIDGQK